MFLSWAKGLRIAGRPQVPCAVCGKRWLRLSLKVISTQLAGEWELDSTWTNYFNEREGLVCLGCRSAKRSVYFAQSIVGFAKQTLGVECKSLHELVSGSALAEFRVAELNSCGSLHPYLAKLPKLNYSEYESKNPCIRSEDLMQLTYSDGSFDLVLDSETLEHVPDFDRALSEIHRILKPGGWHLFTIPIVFDGRPTRQRAMIKDQKVQNLLPQSFHGRPGETKPDYLVFYEFGSDIIQRVANLGFKVELKQDATNPSLITIVSQKI